MSELTTASKAAIEVNSISKYYRLGVQDEMQDSVAASMFQAIKSPIRNFKKYRSLYHFDDVKDDHVPANVLRALKDISFSIQQGERVGIIGSNGAGKSTLLKVLSRITQPTTGTAVIRGRVSSLLEVGTGFHQELSGRENVYLNATILGMRKTEVDRKFDDIVSFAGVDKFLDTPVKRYSSGMKVRLAFAVAANLEPEILIVDEVLAVGDAEFQQKCLSKMEDVGTQGRTVLFVSHNMGAIGRLCDRVIWLKHGQMVEDGNAEEVISSYLNSGTTGHSVWQPEIPEEKKSDIVIDCARLVDGQTGEPLLVTDFDKPLQLEINYTIRQKCRNPSLMISISDAQGNQIFLSKDTDTTDFKGQAREAGDYESKCKLPGFLKAGRYYLSISTHEGARRLDLFENVLIFDVSGVGCNRFNPNRPGIITPLLEWQVTQQTQETIAKKTVIAE